ncbi:MAG: hypothetical protein VKJ46_05300 [Leptolyngbyaceae bacterium]|nr:hypothetical protein [Leptolyngbyaceae bacterium]
MPESPITPQILHTIDILEGLETLLDTAPSPEIEEILQEAWLKVSETFPEDFKDATREDAGAEGLRRYIRVKAFFEDPTQNPIRPEELEAYYRNRAPVDEDSTDFFFPA